MNRTFKSWSSLALTVSVTIASGAVASGVWLIPLARAQDAAPAPDVAKAESLSAEAFDAYSSADYDRAIGLYRKAYQASPSTDILYNLARIYDTKLRDHGLAIEYYERYVNDPEADPVRVETIKRRLSRLREFEAKSAKRRPAAPVSQAEARVDHDTEVRPGSSERAAPGLSQAQVVGILVGAVGTAALGIGAGFGLSARADAEIAHANCDGNRCVSQRGVDAAEDADRAATISTIACAAGGVLLVGGIALVIFGPHDSEREVAAVRFLPYATGDSLGTQLAGRW